MITGVKKMDQPRAAPIAHRLAWIAIGAFLVALVAVVAWAGWRELR